MKTVEWQTEIPGRLQEFKAILRDAREFYMAFPNSPAETRIYVREDGRIGGKRTVEHWTGDGGISWPICDLSAAYPQGRGWMNATFDIAFANAVRMRCDYFNYRAKQRLGGAA